MGNKLLRPPPRDPPLWLDVPAHPWQRHTWTPPDSLPVEPLEYSTTSPVRVPSVGADVAVPFLQSVATGAFVGLLSGAVIMWQAWPWQLPVMLATIAAAMMWFTVLTDTRQLLRKVETFVNRDIDKDGHIGTRHTTCIDVRVEQEGRGPRDLFLQFDDVRPEQLNDLFRGALRGDSLSESRWTGAGKLFSKPKYGQVRDALLDADLVAWVNTEAHAQGLSLSKSGQAVLGRWVEEYDRTHAQARDGTQN